MTFKEALIYLFRSTASAAIVLYAVLLLTEKVIPGSVSPFVDLADVGWLVMIAVPACVATTSRAMTRWIKGVLGALTVGCVLIACGMLWRIADGFGTLYVILVASFILSAALFLYVIITSD